MHVTQDKNLSCLPSKKCALGMKPIVPERVNERLRGIAIDGRHFPQVPMRPCAASILNLKAYFLSFTVFLGFDRSDLVLGFDCSGVTGDPVLDFDRRGRSLDFDSRDWFLSFRCSGRALHCLAASRLVRDNLR